MGCDIHSHAERKENGVWTPCNTSPFDWRSYGMYGFLAGVRNYSAVPPISEPRGFPEDADSTIQTDYDGGWGYHSTTWLTVKELLDFNYDAQMEDRRVMRDGNGGCTCEPGEGAKMTYRDFLGKGFFDDLEKLKAEGAERIVFWFDN